MKLQDIQKRLEKIDRNIQHVVDTGWQDARRVENTFISVGERISGLERLVRNIKTTIKSLSAGTILVLAIIGVVSLLSGCGGGTYRVQHEGNSRHDVVISLNLFGECNAIEDEKLQKKCFKSVTELLAVLAERDNQEDGDDD